ncbi:beta-xyloside ABC transporter [Gracilibacillus boraciitolerans JCM 21714]|uniref:Beta-xyloside ABC transporter n=1 Tax=Gracilibacillus boraciitolerans JCM 21714 TaxID=1298598 RepID=W4VJX7_9BACI|nr:beta-xyloside ABC transporter [Gracilibacillus boraciitolerans JCM 21714]
MKAKGFAKHYYFMMIPGFVWLTLFSIVPMFGIIIAFQNYNPGQGVFGSEFVGFETFEYMFSLNDTYSVFFNTIFIAIMKIVGNLFVPLVFALMLNEVRYLGLKRSIQTIVYLPHFLSWVILGGVLLDIFGFQGPVNQLLVMFGMDPILFFGRADLFPFLVVGSDIWKEFGFNTIIYLAALTGINPALYEAAGIDGGIKA